jgi:hypothetical protein
MTDKTTAGFTADPEEVEALLHNLCGFHLAERDPVARYTVLTQEQVLYDALVAAIRRERGRALAELAERGHRLNEIAELTALGTRQRVQRLIQVGNAAEQTARAQAVAEVQEASRQFDERLAAVEATLDEVVSGIGGINEAQTPITEVGEDYDTVMAKEPFVVERFHDEAYLADDDDDNGYDQDAGYPPQRSDPNRAREDADERFDPLTADIEELAGMLEPTQVMPALSAALQSTKQLYR